MLEVAESTPDASALRNALALARAFPAFRCLRLRLWIGLWQGRLFLLPLDLLGLELVAMPLLRGGVFGLVLLEVLAPEGEGDQVLARRI